MWPPLCRKPLLQHNLQLSLGYLRTIDLNQISSRFLKVSMSKLGNSTMDSNMALVLATLEAGGRLADLRRSLGCGSVTITTIRAAGTLCLHWRGVALGGHLNNLQGRMLGAGASSPCVGDGGVPDSEYLTHPLYNSADQLIRPHACLTNFNFQ